MIPSAQSPGDPFSAAAGSVTHLLRGWASDMPIAVIAGPLHPPLYLYRGGRRELIEPSDLDCSEDMDAA